MRLTYLVVLLALSAGGCATITSSELQPLAISTYSKDGQQLEKAHCLLQNDKGNWEVQTPGYVQVHRSSDDLLVQCKKDGQPDGTARAISRVGAGMFGNIVFGGGIGAIIDHTKGTAYNYPETLNIRMGSAAIFDRQDSEAGTPAAPLVSPAPAAQPVALAASAPTAKVAAAFDPTLSANMPRPGDLWKYQYVDGFSGSAKEFFVHEIIAVQKDEIDERMYVDGGSKLGDERAFTAASTLTLADRPLAKVDRLEFGPYLQAFNPELPFGRFGPISYPSASGPAWRFTGRVLGNEMVSVPAGTFDAMKIELSGTRDIARFVRSEASQARYLIWYSPKAKRYVKYQVERWNQFFQPLAKDRFELVDFKVQ